MGKHFFKNTVYCRYSHANSNEPFGNTGLIKRNQLLRVSNMWNFHWRFHLNDKISISVAWTRTITSFYRRFSMWFRGSEFRSNGFLKSYSFKTLITSAAKASPNRKKTRMIYFSSQNRTIKDTLFLDKNWLKQNSDYIPIKFRNEMEWLRARSKVPSASLIR